MRLRDPRNYLIKKRMQLGLTFRFLFLIILFTLFIAFEVYIIIWPVVTGYISADLLSIVKYQVLFRFFIFVVPVIIVIGLMSIIFSHRIAGPIFNIENKLNKLIEEKDAELIRLRKGDELKELAEMINKLILLVKSSNDSVLK